MGFFNSLALAFSKTSLGITFIRLTTGWWKSSLGLSIFVIDILFAVQGWSYWIQDCDGPPEPFRVQNTREGCISFESIRSLRLTVQSMCPRRLLHGQNWPSTYNQQSSHVPLMHISQFYHGRLCDRLSLSDSRRLDWQSQ